MGLTYTSVCSGIEAATVAWHPLGWTPLSFSEVEPFPSAVLAHHYPSIPNRGDMTKFKEWPDANPDVLVGGTPCQSFSVAGLRRGLEDPRGNLMLTYLAIADRYRPTWCVWENVPGVLSSGGGRDFGTFLGALGQLGYGWAYRILDAQYFGVPQRRRRVFVVGHLGDWRRAAAVLFERHSLQGHPAPSRQAGQGFTHPVAPCIGASGRGLERGGDTRGQDAVVATCMSSGQANAEIAVERSPTLNCLHEAPIVTQPFSIMPMNSGKDYKARPTNVAQPIMAGGQTHGNQGGDVIVTHSLRGEGFDAREDGTERGTPLVPVGVTIHGTDKTVTVMSYTDVAGSLRTKPPGSAENSSSTAVLQPVAIRTAQTSSNGCGIDESGVSYTLDGAQGQAIAFDCKASGQNGFGVGEHIASTSRGTGHGGGHQAVAYALQDDTTPKVSLELNGALRRDAGGEDACVVVQPDTCYNKGIDKGANHASTQEGNARTLLSRVQKEIGAQAFAEWGLGILDSLQHPEVLQQALHGSELRPSAFSRRWVVYCALSRQEDRAAGAMLSLLEACGERCPPQGWGPLEQLAEQLGAYLSELSQPGAQAEKFMRDLWIADEGAGVLREALSAIQEARRPVTRERQPAHATMQVRRLTPECCEFLQGFPRGYTNIPFTHGKPAADGPRYKALGNSMAVPVMRWIGERIEYVEMMT